jgi:hypothetical protein
MFILIAYRYSIDLHRKSHGKVYLIMIYKVLLVKGICVYILESAIFTLLRLDGIRYFFIYVKIVRKPVLSL